MKRGKPFLADWRAVRLWESGLRQEIRQAYWLPLHGWCIGLVIVGTMAFAAWLLRVAGLESLALRYALTLGIGYLAFLGVVRVWAGVLARRERSDTSSIDAPGGGGNGSASETAGPPGGGFRSGQGGDFGGGGADASFGDAAEAGSSVGELASGALEGLGAADEGIVVVVPVLGVFVLGCLLVFGAGSLLLLYFGSEVLLAVAVEVAFGYVSARTLARVARAGWLDVAVQLTWKPLAGALVCAVLLGAAIDVWVPQAQSLPHAIRLLRGSP